MPRHGAAKDGRSCCTPVVPEDVVRGALCRRRGADDQPRVTLESLDPRPKIRRGISIVRFSIPVTPQSIAAPTSATSSSLLYDSEPKDWMDSNPSRPTRLLWPVECVSSWKNVE